VGYDSESNFLSIFPVTSRGEEVVDRIDAGLIADRGRVLSIGTAFVASHPL